MSAGHDQITQFVADVRRRRIESGQPTHIEAEAVYKILDGLLARPASGEVRHAAA